MPLVFNTLLLWGLDTDMLMPQRLRRDSVTFLGDLSAGHKEKPRWVTSKTDRGALRNRVTNNTTHQFIPIHAVLDEAERWHGIADLRVSRQECGPRMCNC